MEEAEYLEQIASGARVFDDIHGKILQILSVIMIKTETWISVRDYYD